LREAVAAQLAQADLHLPLVVVEQVDIAHQLLEKVLVEDRLLNQ
jgi:hypothetical protein